MSISPHLIETYDEAAAFLDARIGLGVKPGLERIAAAMDVLTDPQASYPTIHVAGTNGKTTTVRLLDSILTASGIHTGTYVSPHLHSVERRYSLALEPLDEDTFRQAVADVAPFIEHYETTSGEKLTYFETTVAIAYQAFAAAGVDVAIVEVGLGGRLDATNVVEAAVSVITGIAMDHMEYLGDTIPLIAAEKAAILKEDGLLVTGPLPPAAEGAITAQVAATGSKWMRSGSDFALTDSFRAVGGWHCTVDGLHAVYEDLYLPLHGRHQVDHLATAIAAAEVFLDQPIEQEALVNALAQVTSPGRLEIVGRRPLVLIDGAHNAQGLDGLAQTVNDEFPDTDRVLVVGFRGERDVTELLKPLSGLFDEVIVTEAADKMAIPAADVVAGVRAAFGPDVSIETATPVSQALTEALHLVGEDDMVVVTGSLYVVSDARDRMLTD
ncbi:MAG: bifunctional folylpolyglutamate synthase/dihydrofolate synthase [bacterium]|nr:bifunctional folylpolyglutamate synthase/dihydrofolate synthase [bacterium]